LPADLAEVPRGALLFWPGHVALSLGRGEMIHANGHHMMVVREPIEPALARIAAAHAPLRSLRLLTQPGEGLSKP
jgi:cell wall-associated NlpC family hydrolase